jgi:hypothetical protein
VPIQHVEQIVREAERRAIVQVIRAHPEWTLAQLFAQLDGPHREVLGRVTLTELRDDQLGTVLVPNDGGPPIDPRRLAQAKRLRGPAFVACVRRVLADAPGFVGAAYLRARVGGPRWKLQSALRRLEAIGVVERRGMTSATRYRLGSCEDEHDARCR